MGLSRKFRDPCTSNTLYLLELDKVVNFFAFTSPSIQSPSEESSVRQDVIAVQSVKDSHVTARRKEITDIALRAGRVHINDPVNSLHIIRKKRMVGGERKSENLQVASESVFN